MGGKTATTTSSVTIPKEVMDRYNAVNTRAEGVAETPFQKFGTQASDFVAQINPQQTAGIGAVNSASGAYKPYFASATEATKAGMGSALPSDLDIQKYMSPYTQNVADTTAAMLRQENEQSQSGALGTAASSGAFGGDRAGIAAANLSQQQGLGFGKTMADIYNQGYGLALNTAAQQQGLDLSARQADLARIAAGGQQLAGLGQAAQQAGLAGAEAQINAGTLQQQTDQAGRTALYNQFQQQQAYPFQIAQFLANIAMGTGAQSGSTTTTTQPMPFWSDRRLKHDIKHIGTAKNGLPIYTFKYKGDENDQTHVGFMADEVEKVRPEAVGVAANGYKMVDYERAAKAGGGGVAGPYGSVVGSQPGAMGYIPEAYLQPGDLMVADPAVIDMGNQNVGSMMSDAADFGETIKKLKGQYQDAKDWLGYADGGAAYLENGLGSAKVPNEPKGYLSDTIQSQNEDRKSNIQTAQAPSGGGESGASAVGGLLGGVAKILPFFLSTGGVAGYDNGGKVPVTDGEDLGMDPKAAIMALGKDAVGYAPGHVDPGMASAIGLGAAKPAWSEDKTRAAIDAAAPLKTVEVQSLDDLGVAPAKGVQPPVEAGLAPAKSRLPVTGRPAEGSELSTAASTFARMYNVPEDMFNRLVGTESSWNQDAVSNKGASGLAQLMPGTAEELGVDPSDPMQNLEGGAKYLRQMYDRFGSWDMALAAYNAGPRRLSSAIDRANALGGSYIDYLPAQTQNFVSKITGVGGVAGPSSGGKQASGGLSPEGQGAQSTSAEAENPGFGQWLARNKSNPDLWLSVLSGLGTMASSPSQFLGTSILQGIGGAAQTYAGLRQQEPERVAANIKTAGDFQIAYMRAKELGYEGSPQEYAQKVQYTGPISLTGGLNGVSGVSGPTTGGGTASYMGAALDPFGRGMKQVITLPTGEKVQAGQTYGYLKALETKLVSDVELGIASPDVLNSVRNAIANLNGQIITEGGATVKDPTYEGAMFGASALKSDDARTTELRAAIPSTIVDANEAVRRNNELAHALATMPTTGALSPWISAFGNIAGQLGLSDQSDASKGYEVASKVIADETRSAVGELAGRVDTSVLANAINNATANPTMTPASIEEMLAIRAGVADYKIAYAEAMRDALNRNPNANLAQLEREFAANNRIETFVDKRRPDYAGTIGAKEKPQVTAETAKERAISTDYRDRPIIKENGVWRLQTEDEIRRLQ